MLVTLFSPAELAALAAASALLALAWIKKLNDRLTVPAPAPAEER